MSTECDRSWLCGGWWQLFTKQKGQECGLRYKLKKTEDFAMNDINELTKDITDMTMWTPVEKDLFLQGVEIFGRNR